MKVQKRVCLLPCVVWERTLARILFITSHSHAEGGSHQFDDRLWRCDPNGNAKLVVMPVILNSPATALGQNTGISLVRQSSVRRSLNDYDILTS